jgi:hypothetical protein
MLSRAHSSAQGFPWDPPSLAGRRSDSRRSAHRGPKGARSCHAPARRAQRHVQLGAPRKPTAASQEAACPATALLVQESWAAMVARRVPQPAASADGRCASAGGHRSRCSQRRHLCGVRRNAPPFGVLAAHLPPHAAHQSSRTACGTSASHTCSRPPH